MTPMLTSFVLDLPLAEVTREEGRSLVLVFLATTLGALFSRWHPVIVVPTVVVEIVLGIVIGPEVLGIASVNEFITFLSNFGLALLFFFAGVEVVEHHVPRNALRRGSIGWLMSLAIASILGVGLERAGVDAEWWLLAVALATTALGALVPILSDAGLLPTELGRAVLGTGVAGEFWPIIFISVFLTSVYGAVTEVVLLLVFGLLVSVAAGFALRTRPPRLMRILQGTLHTTGQVGVRAAIFVLALLLLIATDAGFEFVLGAFAAGLIVGLVLDSPDGKIVRMRLEGIGFGFLIPVYFVVTGMTFDLDSLLTADGLLLAGLFLVLLVTTRGTPALLWAPRVGNATNGEPRPVRGDGAPADRRDRRHRAGAWRSVGERRRLVDRRGDDLRVGLPVRRDEAGCPLYRMPTRRSSRSTRPGSTSLPPMSDAAIRPDGSLLRRARAERGHEPLLRKATGCTRFDIVDGPAECAGGSSTVDKGRSPSRASRRPTRDCVVRADKRLRQDRVREGRTPSRLFSAATSRSTATGAYSCACSASSRARRGRRRKAHA